MATFNIEKDTNLSLVMAVEADTEEEAIAKVEAAWCENATFVNNYLMEAEIFDTSTYEVAIYDHPAPFKEMC